MHRATRPRRNHEDTKTRRHHNAHSIIRRGPGRRAARDRWAWRPLRARAPVTAPRPSGLRSRRAQASPLALIRSSRSSRYECGGTDAPLARRPGESPTETDACIRSGRAFHRGPAIFGSPAGPPLHSGQHHRSRFRPFVFFVSSWLRRSFPLCLCGLVRVGIVYDGSHVRSLRPHRRRLGSGRYLRRRSTAGVHAAVQHRSDPGSPHRPRRPKGVRASARWCGGVWCRRGPRTRRSGRG